MIEPHSSYIRVSDTKICSYCYSSKTIKNGHTKTHKASKIFTDKFKNYQYLIPKNLHSTKRFSTNHIERENLNIRTHLKRFQRKTICFSITLAILKIYFWRLKNREAYISDT